MPPTTQTLPQNTGQETALLDACLDPRGTTSDSGTKHNGHKARRGKADHAEHDRDAHRRNLRLALKCDEAGLEAYASSLRECTVTAGLYACTGCGGWSYHTNHCKQRLCAYCAPRKARDRAKLAKYMLTHMDHPKFLTLTMPRCDDLKAGIQRIRKAFSRWRGWKAVQPHITGGYYQIECKAKGDGWHVHIHALIDGTFFPKHQIWQTWAKALGIQEVSVDISSASHPEIAQEVAKYAVKAVELEEWTPEQLREFVTATKGLRLTGTFGKWYNAKIDELLEEPAPEPMTCPCCGKSHCLYPIRAGPFVYGRDWNHLYGQYYSDLPITIPNDEIKFTVGKLAPGDAVQMHLGVDLID